MYRLSDIALKAILNEWRPKEYDPPKADVKDWIRVIESLCDTYGIPDAQRAGCAVKFIAGMLRNVLEGVLKDAEARFGVVHWAQFTKFMVALDRDLQEIWKTLPFLKENPKLGRTALDATMVVQQALPVILAALSSTPLGAPAGLIVPIVQSIVYGVGRTGGLLSLLQSGATTVAPLGMILGTAIGAGNAFKKNGESVTTNEIPSDPPGQRYRLALPAVQAIVKSWKITPYNPPSTDVSGWLSKVRELCGESEVPVTQQALCATHLMRTDCRKAAIAAKCQGMTWDEFTTWLLKYDDEKRAGANGNAEKLLVKKSKL